MNPNYPKMEDNPKEIGTKTHIKDDYSEEIKV